MEKLIKIFISELKAIFPQINVNYYYSESDDQFIILHDNKELEYDYPEFYDAVGKLVSSVFHSKGHYNMVFDYDYFGEIFEKNHYSYSVYATYDSLKMSLSHSLEFKDSKNVNIDFYQQYPFSVENKCCEIVIEKIDNIKQNKNDSMSQYTSFNRSSFLNESLNYKYFEKEGRLVA